VLRVRLGGRITSGHDGRESGERAAPGGRCKRPPPPPRCARPSSPVNGRGRRLRLRASGEVGARGRGSVAGRRSDRGAGHLGKDPGRDAGPGGAETSLGPRV
jgi:hypothetical protein